MKNTLGNAVSVTLFGESHGNCIGAVLDGIAPGFKIDEQQIRAALAQRKGQSTLSTARRESDEFSLVSGVFMGVTTGTPICILIPNQDTHSSDYDPDHMRPSHVDYTAQVKYHGHQDYRGGGHFSGRITAALVAAGDIARQILSHKNIVIGSHLKEVARVQDTALFEEEQALVLQLQSLNHKSFPVIDTAVEDKMKQQIALAKSQGDSVGGVIETGVCGVPAGVGEPWFDSLESTLSHMLFSIPGVKGVSFGGGFDMCGLRGSQVNDALYYAHDGSVKTKTNFSGGIVGGIANGMPLMMQIAVKPTPSIYSPQQTINVKTGQNETFSIKGRHDPAIVHRARTVVEAAVALCLLDALTVSFGTDWQVNL